MEIISDFAHFPCRHCQGKNHCGQCAADIRSALLEHPAVHAAAIDMKEHAMQIDTALPREELLELLERLGVFAD